MESIHNFKYFLSIAIIVLSIPISDNVTKSLTTYFRSKNLDKYKHFFGNTVFILFIRLIIVTTGIVVAGMISGINMNYIFGGIGIVSLMLPITLQSPAQDFVCGLLIIALDKIRVNELIRIESNEFTIEGKVTNIHAFSTSIISPLSNAITDIPNHNLWSMNIQSISRSPRQKILLEVLLSNRNDIFSNIVFSFIKLMKLNKFFFLQFLNSCLKPNYFLCDNGIPICRLFEIVRE